ncbi:MAG: class I SAM-dependent methyltransferase [Nitrospiraceae bacterium]|nr:MAG: class I SAM-dependent methyltransferase [Nitrospiraceae bacterium]
MEKKVYEVIFNIEDNYWWYVGLRDLVFSSIDKFSHKHDGMRILDAGCGTGKFLDECKAYRAFGLDFSEVAINFCKLRNINNLIRGSICEVPLKNNLFNIVVSLDVIYHMGVKNDVNTLKELHEVISPNGILLLNVPAYNFLKSKHDVAIHTRRRYTIEGLKSDLEKAGFRIEIITYRNTLLFPIAAIKRMVDKFIFVNKDDSDSDLNQSGCLFNKIFTHLLFLENKLIMSGVKLPFGLSVFCVARKENS